MDMNDWPLLIAPLLMFVVVPLPNWMFAFVGVARVPTANVPVAPEIVSFVLDVAAELNPIVTGPATDSVFPAPITTLFELALSVCACSVALKLPFALLKSSAPVVVL